MRRGLLLIGSAIAALVLLPLAGMVLTIWAPPPGVAATSPPSLSELAPLVGRTLALAASVASLALVMGSWMAWVEQRAQSRLLRALALMTVLPLVIPSYLMATILREAMAPAGLLGELLGRQGRFTGFWPSVIVLTFAMTPYVQLLVGAALRRLPHAEEEAARNLGAGPWRRLTTITLPHLRPTLAFSLVIVTLYVISDFGSVSVLDCEVLTWELFKAYRNYDTAGAAWLGFGLVLLVIPLLISARLLHGKAQVERGVGGQRLAVRRALPGWARALTVLFQGGFLGLGVLLPVWTLTRWVRAGMVAPDENFSPLAGDLWDSLWLSGVGASLTLTLALILVWSAVRLSRRGWALESGAYLSSGLPGVLVAFGIFQMVVSLKRIAPVPWGDTNLWSALEGVGALVLLGYAMRFMAEAYAALKPTLLRLDVRQEESARSLGAGPLRRLGRVVLPALAPGLAACYMLLFLAIIKELPITMMLAPTGDTTLAYRIFDAQNEGLLPEVGLAGLVLLALAFGMQLIMLRWREHG